MFIFLFFKGLLVPICVHVSGICFLNHKTSFYKHLAVAQCHFYRRKLRVCCRVLAASPPGGECLGDHLFEMEKPKHFARGPGSPLPLSGDMLPLAATRPAVLLPGSRCAAGSRVQGAAGRPPPAAVGVPAAQAWAQELLAHTGS